MPATAFRSFGILPAAGRSRRMGQPKLLLPWQGRTVLEAAAAPWLASEVCLTLAVLHPEDAELAAVCRAAGLTVVQPAVPPPDMKASVLAALDYLQQHAGAAAGDVWLVAPADLPCLTAAVINAVLAAYLPESPAPIVPVHEGRRGHPVLFPWSLAAAVPTLPADAGLKQLLLAFPPQEIPAPAECISADLDTPADYQRLRQGY